MWAAWDLALDLSLSQLVEAASFTAAAAAAKQAPPTNADSGPSTAKQVVSTAPSKPAFSFKTSPFFAEQLTAFQVWLQFGERYRPPPEQLPIVLQVTPGAEVHVESVKFA